MLGRGGVFSVLDTTLWAPTTFYSEALVSVQVCLIRLIRVVLFSSQYQAQMIKFIFVGVDLGVVPRSIRVELLLLRG